MHLLIVSASLPYPPASGGALRTYGILQGLHDAGHAVTLLTFGDAPAPATDTPLDTICEKIITVPTPRRSTLDRLQTLALSSTADIETRLYSEKFQAVLLRLLREHSFDVVQFEGIEVACYLPIVKQYSDVAVCFDTFNAEADLQHTIYEIDRSHPSRWAQAAYSWVQSKRIARYEADLCQQADLVIAVSDEDAALLGNYDQTAPIHVVPSGIYAADYATSETTISLPENALVYTGKMDYRPNVDAMLWFSEAILPHIPNAHLTIVGQKPHARIQHLPEQENITLTGWVDSVLPYLHAADVYIAPLRMGSGTRLKILEAMASGCAVVATPIAAAGLSDAVTSALRLADDPPAFANAVNDLLAAPNARHDLGTRAQAQIEAHYDWSVLIPRLLHAYEEVNIG